MDEIKLNAEDFGAVKARLEEIAKIVGDDDVPLDVALDLFEEAVSLGMQVSDLLEVGVLSDADSSDEAAVDVSSAEKASSSDSASASEDASSSEDATATNQSDSLVS